MKLPFAIAIAAGLLVGGVAAPSYADITSGSGGGGYVNCYDWCLGHNKTVASRVACFHGCDDYWGKHGVVSQLPPASPPPRRPVFDGLNPVKPGPGKSQSPSGQTSGILVLHHPTKLR